MSLETIESLWKHTKELMYEESRKHKFGEMSLLSMFKHGYENSHSDVLRFLLNPKAGHRHNDEYLNLFLQEIGIESILKDPLDMDALNTYEIHPEFPVNGRYIDIFMKINNETCIIIENKIWARDQEAQLHDYYNGIFEKGFTNIYVLYLTLTGYEASDYSKRESVEIFEKMKKENKFINISYQNHILRWLKQLSFKSTEHTLRSAIEQYIYTIEILTHQTGEDKNMKDKIYQLAKNLKMGDNLDECRMLRDILNYYIRIEPLKEMNEIVKSFSDSLNDEYPHKLTYTLNNLSKFDDEIKMREHAAIYGFMNIGVGIEIEFLTRNINYLTVALESKGNLEDKIDYVFGIMAHDNRNEDIINAIYTDEMNLFIDENGYVKNNTKWWYFSKCINDINNIETIHKDFRNIINILRNIH